MKISAYLFCIPGIILFYSSCKKETELPPDVGYGYYPYEIGKYIIYDVDSIVYDDFDNDTDHYKFLLKEVIESMFTDNAGRPAMRLERYVKNYNPLLPYDSIQWALKDVWTAVVTNTAVEKTEENIKYVKLCFPVTENKTWNGNAYNTLGDQTYTYTDIAIPRTYNSLSFDSTLTVTQEDNTNLIEKNYFVEVFAKGVGLVYKEIIAVRSNTIIPSVPVTDRIDSGLELKMKIVSYGTE